MGEVQLDLRVGIVFRLQAVNLAHVARPLTQTILHFWTLGRGGSARACVHGGGYAITTCPPTEEDASYGPPSRHTFAEESHSENTSLFQPPSRIQDSEIIFTRLQQWQNTHNPNKVSDFDGFLCRLFTGSFRAASFSRDSVGRRLLHPPKASELIRRCLGRLFSHQCQK